jgi:hypothetical protein
LLHVIGGLMHRIGWEDEFQTYLAGVRAAHKQKRSFMKLLDEAGW